MHRIRTGLVCGAMILAAAGIATISGCSSSPDQAQMQQLDDLKKEYADLQSQVASKEQEKANLDKEIADKNASLKKCHDDQAIVRQRLAQH